MAKLEDVARLANVSKMTVSRVINHPEKVTSELRNLVRQAMAELDYRPNLHARALSQQKMFVVQVLVLEQLEVVEPYYIELLMGIADELARWHYTLQLVTDPSRLTDQCDAYIITGAKKKDFDWIRALPKPVVLFGENREDFCFVDTKNREATAQATAFARMKGYRNFVFIGIDAAEDFECEREAGYRQALLQGEEPQVIRLENRSRSAEELILTTDEWKDNTCFICASDRLALGLVRGLLARGKSIPEAFGVIGFDGFFLDRISKPRLTTMRQPIRQMGVLSVRQVMALVAGRQIPRSCYCSAELIERETTRK